MPDFEILHNLNKVNNCLSRGNWVDAEKFNSENRVVDEYGNEVTADYKGKKYRLIFKKERTFLPYERIGRVVLAILAMAFSFGLAIISKSIKKLFTEKKVKIRFGTLIIPLPSQKNPIIKNPNPIESQKNKKEEYKISKRNLQKGVKISKEIILKIQECFKDIINRNNTKGIKYYNCNTHNSVFELTEFPKYIFKMKSSQKIFNGEVSTRQRYRSMITAKTICRIHNLYLLVIPNAKLFTIKIDNVKYDIIAEKILKIDPDENTQKEYFEKYAENLYETIRQFTTFTCKFSLSDVNFDRNILFLVNNLNKNKEMPIALFDLEERLGADIGLFGCDLGGMNRPGLVGFCTNEKQIDIIKEVVEDHNKKVKEKHKISTDNFKNAWEKRKKELKKKNIDKNI